MPATTSRCEVCGLPATSRCSSCHFIFYCSREHQRLHWKAGGHKHRCGQEQPAESLVCARCNHPCDGSACYVPHPAHMREDTGRHFGSGSISQFFHCMACRASYCVKEDMVGPGGKYIVGPKWCFQGQHSTLPPKPGDLRVVDPEIVELACHTDLQADIDALGKDVRVLTVMSGNGMFNDSLSFTLDRKLPNLEKLRLIDVSWTRIVLTAANTPRLKFLEMQNVPDSASLELELPELETFIMNYWCGDSNVINHMLKAATKLKVFDCYKLWVDDLTFASNTLTYIRLHRSDCLQSLTLWAPNLCELNLQACYDLREIDFLKTHALAKSLPPGHESPMIKVDTQNGVFSKGAKQVLREHPRVVKPPRGYEHPSYIDEPDPFSFMVDNLM